MSKSICTRIRRELEEMAVVDSCSTTVLAHLSECVECSNFQQQDSKLRHIVGGLGTVNAPADFDFRLRSRLANENARSAFHLNRSLWSIGQRSAAVASLLLILLGGAILVRHFANKDSAVVKVTDDNRSADALPDLPPESKPSDKPFTASSQESNPSIDQTGFSNRRPAYRDARKKQTVVAVDYSGERAPVIGSKEETIDTDAFPINASQQSLKVSLFDGRGKTRTISLPTVSFGSQRLVPTGASYAPKGIW